MIDIKSYYLDMEKVFVLDNKSRIIIIDMYRDLVNLLECKNYDSAISYFNTLTISGYLKNKLEEERQEKIGTLING